MATAKSDEAKAAKSIINALDKRNLDKSLVGYFLHTDMTHSDKNVFVDVFFHFLKMVANEPPKDYMTADEARLFVLADSIVRGMENSGFIFT